MKHKPVIGMVGGIGAGKSLVARQLASLGCAVIDADQLARRALEQDDVRDRLVQWWGPGVLDASNRVNRAAVGALVFDNPEKLDRLEALIHPIVHRDRAHCRRRHQLDPAVRAIVEDCPLLIESGLDAECDAVILVDASRQNRLQRVTAGRGWDAAELDRREKNQVGLDTKRRRADYVISNDAGEHDCLEQTRSVLSQILREPR